MNKHQFLNTGSFDIETTKVQHLCEFTLNIINADTSFYKLFYMKKKILMHRSF